MGARGGGSGGKRVGREVRGGRSVAGAGGPELACLHVSATVDQYLQRISMGLVPASLMDAVVYVGDLRVNF